MDVTFQASQIDTPAYRAMPSEKPSSNESGTLDKLEETLKKGSDKVAGEKSLSAHEENELQKLRRRDRGVHQHEMMHRIYAGEHARGHITYTYEVGPDGKRYAVHGEVSIDASPVPGDPEATMEKMEAIRRAATAPRDPSSADRRAAMMAQRMAASARTKLRQQQAEEAQQKKQREEFDELQEPVETDRRLMGPNQVVNLFRSTIRPELVSNLFDLLA